MKTALIVCLGLSLMVAVFASSPPECVTVRRLSGSVCDREDITVTRDRTTRAFYCCEDSNLVPLRKMDWKDGVFQTVCICVTLQQEITPRPSLFLIPNAAPALQSLKVPHV
ncbi:hypothetical protein PoB_003951600 [Plakobranchus ocellatus]|uniref:Uncharacterized protein n=1 Tax=Plakobranchus ocellatus TaxID=259542 RepID=A0AAV4AXP8_9GAST|nr:hypothetical protein PoB_003951600 [Plakobranchus ocellatus]